MKKSYVFIYNSGVGTRDEVRNFIDSLPEILDWRIELPNTFYLITELSADQLADKIRTINKNNGFFLITEVHHNRQGWQSRDAWNFISQKA